MRLRLVVALTLAAAALVVRPAAQGPTYTFTDVTSPLVLGPYSFSFASAMTSDAAGNLYVYDSGNFVIRKVTPDGRVFIVAGKPGVDGHDDGQLSEATLRRGSGITFAVSNSLVLTDSDHTVRRIGLGQSPTAFSIPQVKTVAGRPGIAGSDDGPAGAATFRNPTGVVDDNSVVYVADSGNHTLRKLPLVGNVETLAGSAGAAGSADGVGSAARFNEPRGMLRDARFLVVADRGNGALRRVALDGQVPAGVPPLGEVTTVPQSGPARLSQPRELAVDPGGTYFVSDGIADIFRVLTVGVVSTFASDNFTHGFNGLVADAGSVQVLDIRTNVPVSPPFGATEIVRISSDGTKTARQLADSLQWGGIAFSGGLLHAASAQALRKTAPSGATRGVVPFLDAVRAVAVDDQGNAYVAAGCGILKLLPAGVAQMIAGTSELARSRGCGAVDAPRGATDIWNQTARFADPEGIARSASGTIYVADTGNSTIRTITSNQTVTTILGAAGVTGTTDGFGTASRFNLPTGLALDAAGNLFIADTGNHTIRKVTPQGDVTTFAGAAGSTGTADGIGVSARFNGPRGLAFGPDGTLFVADTGNSRIRMVSPSAQVSTLTGATFNAPRGVTVDPSGAVYVADTGNEIVRVGTVGAATMPAITAQPVDAMSATVGSATFSVTATGTPSPGYQWQISTDAGATWSNLNESFQYGGVYSDTLRVTEPPRTLSGARFRCVVSNMAGSVTSAAATLSVVTVSVAPSALSFAGVKRPGATAYELIGGGQTVNVNWNGPAAGWTVTADKPWIQVGTGTASGSGTGNFVVQISGDPGVTPTAAGATTMGTVTLSSVQPNLTISIPVRFTAYTADSAPTGVFDTPANNSTGLSGSVAVTGWAIDDVGVDHVEIWRDPVGNETPVPNAVAARKSKIFVGFATLVPGARPDVQAVFPNAPGVYRAGWGYMLLTYGLPNQGNGVYTLHAFAVDGPSILANATLIGSKTITSDNVNATKPFGAIDTPGPGSTASGVIQNFGWALTPGTSCSIANPNVRVSIDSGALTPVVYGDARSDIAGAFPGYTNASAAGAHYTLDTTTLTNGLHTIGWLVTDSCGRTDGVGSRFFTVANSASVATASQQIARASVGEEALAHRSFSEGGSLVRGIAPADPPPAGSDGTRVVQIDQGERIELQLPGDAPYVARQMVSGEPRDLPIGSSFDAATGTFYWQPAAGFLGAYELRFATSTHTERIRVVVGPPIRMVIDTPHAGNVLDASGFTVAGWAVDLASLGGAGIDTLHTWAYPVGGAAPVFVGVAKVGGPRADVARLYGASFGAAGFTVTGSLAPGTYDLVVYAHSAASNSFAAAETVRVVVR